MEHILEEISELQKRVFHRALDQGYTGGKPLTLEEIRDNINHLLAEGFTFEEVGKAVNLSLVNVKGLSAGTLSQKRLLAIARFPDGHLWGEKR